MAVLNETTGSQGANLVPDQWSELLYEGLLKDDVLGVYGNRELTTAKTERMPVVVDRTAAAFVGENTAITETDASFDEIEINVKKIAKIVRASNEVLADNQYNLEGVLTGMGTQAFAEVLSQHTLGYAAGVAISSSLDACLNDSTQEVELGTTDDRLQLAISAAMDKVEQNGYTADTVILPIDAKRHIRDARRAVESADKLYASEAEACHDLRVVYSSNLATFLGAAAADRCVGFVLDSSAMILRVRKDMTLVMSDQASVGGQSTFERDQTAFRWIMRAGANIFDVNRSVCKIMNES